MSDFSYYLAGMFVGMMVFGGYRPRIMRKLSHLAHWLSRKMDPKDGTS